MLTSSWEGGKVKRITEVVGQEGELTEWDFSQLVEVGQGGSGGEQDETHQIDANEEGN